MITHQTNRKYKSSVFTKLFGEKNNLIELYNAIENTNYTKDTDIRITTLEDVLFMEQMNDISFLIDNKLIVLIEHQSTINQNMPLRILLYMARTYEKITENDNLYRTTQITIPKPEFIVLYNGIDKVPDKQVLKLSDMFEKHGKANPVNLELLVKVYNINKGHNREFAKKSVTLNGYETFIASIRDYEKSMSRSEAIERAVKDCIKRNILKKFLEENSSEVRNMLLSEWKLADAQKVWKEEGIAIGEARGEARGIAVGKAEGIAVGEARGEARGIAVGEARGEARGIAVGEARGIDKLLSLLRQGYSVDEAEKKLLSKKPNRK